MYRIYHCQFIFIFRHFAREPYHGAGRELTRHIGLVKPDCAQNPPRPPDGHRGGILSCFPLIRGIKGVMKDYFLHHRLRHRFFCLPCFFRFYRNNFAFDCYEIVFFCLCDSLNDRRFFVTMRKMIKQIAHRHYLQMPQAGGAFRRQAK